MTSVAEARARAEERDEGGRRERFIERLSSSWWTGRVVLAIVMVVDHHHVDLSTSLHSVLLVELRDGDEPAPADVTGR